MLNCDLSELFPYIDHFPELNSVFVAPNNFSIILTIAILIVLDGTVFTRK